jgi:hypothetical protein
MVPVLRCRPALRSLFFLKISFRKPSCAVLKRQSVYYSAE